MVEQRPARLKGSSTSHEKRQHDRFTQTSAVHPLVRMMAVVMAAAAIGSGGGMKRRESGGSCKLADCHRRRKAAEAGVNRRRGDAAVVGDGGLTGWL